MVVVCLSLFGGRGLKQRQTQQRGLLLSMESECSFGRFSSGSLPAQRSKAAHQQCGPFERFKRPQTRTYRLGGRSEIEAADLPVCAQDETPLHVGVDEPNVINVPACLRHTPE